MGRFSRSSTRNNDGNQRDPLDASNATENFTLPSTNYQSFPDAHSHLATSSSMEHTDIDLSATHRGFSTSIYDDFHARASDERVDCCATVLCGVLQSDRDRYLLTGVRPPTLSRRLWLHVGLPIMIFLAAGFGAMHIRNIWINQFVSTCLVLMILVYISMQCLKGRYKHVHIRKDLLFTKYQLIQQQKEEAGRQGLSVIDALSRHRPDDESVATAATPSQLPDYYLGQSNRDLLSAHPYLCGLYPTDRVMNDCDERRTSNATLSRHLLSCLCPPLCGMHLQLCGICALAQEAREMERLLPDSYRRLDYITMQAYADYFPAVYRAQCNDASDPATSRKWLPPLSRLSYRIVQGFAVVSAILCVWSIIGPLYWSKVVRTGNHSHAFGPWDFVVYVSAILQAVGLLALIRYALSRNCGQIPLGSRLSMDAMVKYFASGFCLSVILAVFWEAVISLLLKAFLVIILAILGIDVQVDPSVGFGRSASWLSLRGAQEVSEHSSFLEAFGRDHPIAGVIILFIDAFFMAALVEEVCKYFGFRMVEHPDFLTARELNRANAIVYGDATDADNGGVVETTGSRASREEQDYRHHQMEMKQAQALATTLAMVSTAMGFACCENLVYVFGYSGAESVVTELSVLVARSLFPVHPLAAALQSISVIERDQEGGPHGLGRIIKTAVLFHGSYDFFILVIDFLTRLTEPVEQDVDESFLAIALSLGFSVAAMVAAIFYYLKQSRLQWKRLGSLDQEATAASSGLA